MNNNQGSAPRGDQGAQGAGSVATEYPNGGGPGERHEVGDAQSSRRDPPHVDVNARGAEVQDAHGNAAEIPTLGANASGSDASSTEEHPRHVDPASAYEGRPEEDKDHSAGA